MTRPIRVLALDAVSPAAQSRLEAGVFEIAPEMPEPEAILVRSFDMHGISLPPTVLAVCRAGVGVNTIPVDDLARRGIPVFNAPGANANAVKELVIAGMVIGARRIAPAWEFARGLAGDDDAIADAAEAGKKRFVGFEIAGRTLGVVGLGAIGVEVANAAAALGCRVIGFDPMPSEWRVGRLSPEVRQAASVDEVFRGADFVTIHVPLDDSTQGLVSTDRLATMAPGGVLLNFARERVVDTPAVIDALDRRILSSYVTDFPTAALKDHPGVTALPHLGASTIESQEKSVVAVLETLRRYLHEGIVQNSVNFPGVVVPARAGDRLAVVHANASGIVGVLTSRLEAAGLAAVDLVEATRGEVAYTLIDVTGVVPAEVPAALSRIEGVITARVVRGSSTD